MPPAHAMLDKLLLQLLQCVGVRVAQVEIYILVVTLLRYSQ